MHSYQLVQVDVFTDTALEGNALAVFLDGRGLSTARMQAITREMNLSETTFILPPENEESDARVRIFTPACEVPFAGHPTIGTAYVLSRQRTDMAQAHIRLHENIGVIPVRCEADGRFFMQFPDPSILRTLENRDAIASALGLGADDLLPGVPIQVASSGVPFLYVALRDRESVDALQFDERAMRDAAGENAGQVFVYAPNGTNRVYSRMFAPLLGIAEDPATGAASGPLTLLLRNAGLISGGDPIEAVSEQGTKMGRRSLIFLRSYAGGRIEIGGRAVQVMTAELTIPD